MVYSAKVKLSCEQVLNSAATGLETLRHTAVPCQHLHIPFVLSVPSVAVRP